MKTIDITQVLSPDLKSRVSARDLDLYIKNSGEKRVTLDFSKVEFATRSFIDEFYNLFMKRPSNSSYKVIITNVPADINSIMEAVSRTQTNVKVIPSHTPVISFGSLKDAVKYLQSASV